MSKLSGPTSALLLGLVFSVVAFSVAIATRDRDAQVPDLAPRAITSNLNFANPVVGGSRDLGDAVVGSACFVRTIGVTGGLPPFTYSINSNGNALAAANLALVSRPLVGLFGTSPNTIIPTTTLAGPLTFGVTVFDSTLSSNSNPFTLNILSGQNQFRFAQNQLNDGQQYRDYVCSLPVINGAPPYNFGVVTGTVVAGGKTQSSLTAIGLNLTPDGMVIGQPLVSGTITFTAACTDAGGNFAKSRNGTTTNQVITLNVLPNVVVSNTVVVTAFSATGDTANGGKDKASLSAQVNLNGQPLSTLTGPITFRIGNSEFVTGTGSKGKFDLVSGEHAVHFKTPTVKASINTNGQLKATFSNQSFGVRTSFGQISLATVVPIEVIIGNVTDGMSVVAANAKPQKGTKFNLSYKLGSAPKGGKSGTLAGAFIVTSVTGKDDTKGGTGDSWKVAFIAVPPSGSSFANAGTSATVKIGSSFSDSEPVVPGKGTVKTSKLPKVANKLTSLSMSDKGKGTYQTGPIDTTLTGIKKASNATTDVNYTTEIDLGTTFGGAGLLAIFPKKSQWTSKNPSK